MKIKSELWVLWNYVTAYQTEGWEWGAILIVGLSFDLLLRLSVLKVVVL